MREQEIDAKAKVKAEIYRELADLIDLADALPSDSDMTPADYIRKQADELDPPKPDIPDGHVWYRWDSMQEWMPGIVDDGMITGRTGLDTRPLSDDIRDGLHVKSARTLEPGQVALPVHLVNDLVGGLVINDDDAELLASEITRAEAERLERDKEAER